MCWKGLQADTQYCRGPVMAVKPHGSQQSAQAAPYLVRWSKQWSMSAFGLCPLKNCPLEENMMMSCGWLAWGNSHFTHLILKGIFKSSADIDAKYILSVWFVCRWAQGKTAGLCVGNKPSASRIHKDCAAHQAGGADPVQSEWMEGCHCPSCCPIWCPRWVQCRLVSHSQVQREVILAWFNRYAQVLQSFKVILFWKFRIMHHVSLNLEKINVMLLVPIMF